MLDSKMLRWIYEPKKQEVRKIQGSYITKTFIISSLQQILLGCQIKDMGLDRLWGIDEDEKKIILKWI
jgi:hypothetical protein